jgi:putative membrane protein
MLKPLKFLLIATALIFVLWYLVPGIRISSPLIAAEVVLVLFVTNLILGNILRLISLPVNRMSFGLIGFGINLLVIALTAKWIDGFQVSGIIALLLFALALSVSSYVIDQKIL